MCVSFTRILTADLPRFRSESIDCRILWNTRYLQAVLVELQQQGVNVAPTIVTRVAPLGWEHIGLTGDYVRTDAGQPSDGVLRPLRRRESMLAA